ncbi:MAG: xylose isomerase [Methylobacteriaceae bacterium]|jgi:xylose isomerase|nr:xylose isomerase [Methylobacteriaceae bacterium]
MTEPYFDKIDVIRYEGPESDNPLAFHHYNPDEVILGKPLKEQLRLSIAYWHTFCWQGTDMFGAPAFNRPWFSGGDPLDLAKAKADVAFEFFRKITVPFYCFHDVDVAPEGANLKEYIHNMAVMTDVLAKKQQESGIKLLWGTANVFTNPRYGAGAFTNPDPDICAMAAAQVVAAMGATHALGGENYVLWGGREGYETLLNTDLKHEREQAGRFLQLVVAHKHKIGFKGTILIEPKPQEPTKHQYDYDVGTVYGFLKQFGLENEVRINIEANHATLAGHSFQHEIAMAIALGAFGSVDANRGDPQCGWDTDQFPNSVEENALVLYEIFKAGGFTTGGFNFDAKVRRQSTCRYDLFHGHIGAMDVLAVSAKIAAKMVEDGKLAAAVSKRYAGWDGDLGKKILSGGMSLADIAAFADEKGLDPKHSSGRQEKLENLVNRYIFG